MDHDRNGREPRRDASGLHPAPSGAECRRLSWRQPGNDFLRADILSPGEIYPVFALRRLQSARRTDTQRQCKEHE